MSVFVFNINQYWVLLEKISKTYLTYDKKIHLQSSLSIRQCCTKRQMTALPQPT